jgi:NitT/TauT family transport system substrate-binding protein
VSAILGLVALAGCTRSEEASPSADVPVASTPTGVTFLADWYPQPEHGGFYQALERGFYREAGLDVTIVPGGPRAMVLQKVGLGQAELAVWRTDDVTVAVSRDVPIVCLAGVFQRSPQALMFHAAYPVSSYDDLRGRPVMAGAASVWVQAVERRHGMSIQLMPLSFTIAQFLEDPLLVQQCMATSEPYQVARAGVEAGIFLLDEAGTGPYHAIIGNREWVRMHPDEAAAFVRASLRGWRDFLEGDPQPAFDAIARLNPGHDEGSMRYSREAMLRHELVLGSGEIGEELGALGRGRLEQNARLLHELGVAARLVEVDELIAPGFPLATADGR